MINKVYTVTDIGPGDGGKGGIIHALSCKLHPRYIVKEGGAQGSHGVVQSCGESFNFSQWGCGTLEAVPTFLSERMVISPHGLLKEAEALRRLGIYNPWSMLYCHPDCICATPYHQIWSRNYELSLGSDQHGTVGTGIGKAYRQARDSPRDAIYAKELDCDDSQNLRRKLELQREIVSKLSANFDTSTFSRDDLRIFQENQKMLEDDELIDEIVRLFRIVGERLNFITLSDVLKSDGVLVVERSHGVLTDNATGIRPHVSELRTLPIFSNQMFDNAGFRGKNINLAVRRAYEIRHGAGPMPSREDRLRDMMLPSSHKDTNRWQGEVRVGYFDARLTERALEACGGPDAFDGLAISWFDQIMLQGSWGICADYDRDGEIVSRDQFLDLETLRSVRPIVEWHTLEPKLSNRSKSYIFDTCAEILAKYVDIPLRLLSIGADEQNKIFK